VFLRAADFVQKISRAGIKIQKKRRVLLFSDLLMWTSVKHHNYKGHFFLYGLTATVYASNSSRQLAFAQRKNIERTGFTLSCLKPASADSSPKDLTTTFWCDDLDLTEVWVEAIKDAIALAPAPVLTRENCIRDLEDEVGGVRDDAKQEGSSERKSNQTSPSLVQEGLSQPAFAEQLDGRIQLPFVSKRQPGWDLDGLIETHLTPPKSFGEEAVLAEEKLSFSKVCVSERVYSAL
jgi:hypothetical protein